jgi:hypothetical protein
MIPIPGNTPLSITTQWSRRGVAPRLAMASMGFEQRGEKKDETEPSALSEHLAATKALVRHGTHELSSGHTSVEKTPEIEARLTVPAYSWRVTLPEFFFWAISNHHLLSVGQSGT